MDSFNQKVDRINAAKEAIKVSLTNKGLNPTDNIEDYAALVDSIEQGSGSGSTIKVGKMYSPGRKSYFINISVLL